MGRTKRWTSTEKGGNRCLEEDQDVESRYRWETLRSPGYVPDSGVSFESR